MPLVQDNEIANLYVEGMDDDALFRFICINYNIDRKSALDDTNPFEEMGDNELFDYIRASFSNDVAATTKKKSTGAVTRRENEARNKEKVTCPNCNRLLCASNLRNHCERYCRHRPGQKAVPARVKRNAVNVTSDVIFRSECSRLIRKRTSMSGAVRDYDLLANERIVDVELWLRNEEGLVLRMYEVFNNYLVKGRMVLRAWFVKLDHQTGNVIRRVLLYLPSQAVSHIHNFQHWYYMHARALLKQLDSFNHMDSDLVLDTIEALEIKISVLANIDGQSFFNLPDDLKRKQAVINVNSPTACFKFALLSILHYDDIKDHRGRMSNYKTWEDELNFSDIDVNNVDLKNDIIKIEELNKIKINIHVWERGLQGCRFNRRNALFEKTINLLLVVNSEGKRHYCGIPSISRLYRHTKSTGNMQHMCDRCIRSFGTQENLAEHYQWCSQGRLQIERMPKHNTFSYTQNEKELRPLKVVYADIESYIKDTIHYPVAIASYNVWHNKLPHKQVTLYPPRSMGSGCDKHDA